MTTYYLKNDETGVIVDVIAPNRIEAIEMVTTQYGGNAYDWQDRFEDKITISKRDLFSVILEKITWTWLNVIGTHFIIIQLAISTVKRLYEII